MFTIVYQIDETVFYQRGDHMHCLELRDELNRLATFVEIYAPGDDIPWDLSECQQFPYDEPAPYGL